MSLILNIDTSSAVCSVCLAADGEVIAEHNDISGNKHAAGLTTYIQELMESRNLGFNQLTAVAVSSGPGSYTGLRIGTSVAKGICYGLDIPLIAVSTLKGLAHAMAAKYPDANGVYIPMLDARRDDVYTAVYSMDNNIIEKDNFATVGVDFPDIARRYNVKNIYFGGPGAAKVADMNFIDKFGTVIENLICVAKNINSISYQYLRSGTLADYLYFEPVYLKEFEGGINRS